MTKSYLGIDYGRARIGIAHSFGQIAKPVLTIKNKGTVRSIAAIGDIMRKLCREGLCNEGADWCAVLGVPLSSEGAETEMSAEIRRFGAQLFETLGIKVCYHNERYSSAAAEDFIRDRLHLTKRDMPKELVDTVAAAVILQGYLDLHSVN